MLNKLTVRTRLLILLGVMIIGILGMGILGYNNTTNTREEIHTVYFGGVNSIESLKQILTSYRVLFLDTIQKARDKAILLEEASDNIKRAQENINLHLKKYLESYSKDNTYQTILNTNKRQELVNQMESLINDSMPLFIKMESIFQQQDINQFNDLNFQQIYGTISHLSNVLDQLILDHVEETKSEYNNAIIKTDWIASLTLILIILVLGITIPLAILIIKSINKPLNYALENINSIAEGDIKREVRLISGGELGNVLNALQNMVNSSEKMSSDLTSISLGDLTIEPKPRSDKDVLGKALQYMIHQLRSMIGEIIDGINTLTASSQEINASLSQVSAGTAETAAAVTETTTTIEELKQTAHVSADKAKDVLNNADDTLKTVKKSEASVSATIEDMSQIKEKMQIISDSILKLSEKSLAISEIMDSVNDLAEQSNLLAVNAAIEAAKAGEQGRSFGVVAQEIRTLAEQSKHATVQVRSLLNEIQAATHAAVLATEQGSKAVLKGVEQSRETSQAISELAKNMSKVAQATNQIVLSSNQQLIGVEQVTVAMTNINEAANQHVENLKQIEVAVSSFSQVGIALKDIADQYKLPTERDNKSPKNEGLRKNMQEMKDLHDLNINTNKFNQTKKTEKMGSITK